MGEGQLEAVFENCVKTLGAQWMSFPPVVAGGNRANCLHYITNNRNLESVTLIIHNACFALCPSLRTDWKVLRS